MRLRVLIAGPLAGLLAPLALWAALPVPSAGDPGPGQLGTIQSKIGVTKQKIARRRGKERVLTTDISRYTHKIDVLGSRIGSLQSREQALQADLERKRAQLDVVQGHLRAERARLLRLRARLVVGRRLLARRLVEIYEADQPDLVTVVLDAHGFADLLERGDFLRRISDADRRIVTIVRNAKADAASSAARLAVLERRQQAVAAAILSRRQDVALVREQLQGSQAGLARTRAGEQSTLSQVRAQRQDLEGKLTALVQEENAVQARLAAASQEISRGGAGLLPAGAIRHGSGSLIWPVNGPITSPFCERRAWEACHPGIDIGVPAGTPVRAAAAGRVVLQQSEAQSGGYGNFMCLQHTASLSTCYAHLTSFDVGMGASVAQGQVIAISGCTGRCYGPHLHFEVRINGAVTDPMNYL